MTELIHMQVASKKDKSFIAHAMVEASGGICEYLLQALKTPLSPEQLLGFEVAKDSSPLSYQHCLIAYDEICGEKCGLISAYPAEAFPSQLSQIAKSKQLSVADFYNIDLPKNTLYIDTVYVSPQYRGRGISTLLFKAIERRCHAHQYMALYVWKSNEVALKLYEKLGFQFVLSLRSPDPNFPIQDERYLMTCSIERFLSAISKRILPCA